MVEVECLERELKSYDEVLLGLMKDSSRRPSTRSSSRGAFTFRFCLYRTNIIANVNVKATQTLDRTDTTIVCQLTMLQSSMTKVNWIALIALRRSLGVPFVSLAVRMICSLRFVSGCESRSYNLSSSSFEMLNFSADSPEVRNQFGRKVVNIN